MTNLFIELRAREIIIFVQLLVYCWSYFWDVQHFWAISGFIISGFQYTLNHIVLSILAYFFLSSIHLLRSCLFLLFLYLIFCFTVHCDSESDPSKQRQQQKTKKKKKKSKIIWTNWSRGFLFVVVSAALVVIEMSEWSLVRNEKERCARRRQTSDHKNETD